MAKLSKRDYDAVIVGSGPNGLASAIALQREGLSVLMIEGSPTVGGGCRSAEITLPGFVHDVCSAVQPMAANSPFFNRLPLERHGLEFIYPAIDAAHPFDNGGAAILCRSLGDTAASLGSDAAAYKRLIGPTLRHWTDIDQDLLSPLRFPAHPIQLARFGLSALQPATWIAKQFDTMEARGLWAGVAAHSIQPLSNIATSAIGIVLLAAGHIKGWPVVKGGSGRLTDALASCFVSLGGKIETGRMVRSLSELPSAHAVLFDVTPRQLLQIAGYSLSSIYRWQLQRYRYGMGVFKIDWALDGPAPFAAQQARLAGTVHIGNTFEEIAASEQSTSKGHLPEKPFILFSQPSIIDESRAPRGKHTAWAYCHVPNGSTHDMTEIIEKQVERFAPGFRDLILARSTMNTSQLESYNPNYIGGDIGGGEIDITQLFTRPALRSSPYRTSKRGLYICSSSTPPGGGVHGMCGYNAAKRALKDVFGITPR